MYLHPVDLSLPGSLRKSEKHEDHDGVSTDFNPFSFRDDCAI